MGLAKLITAVDTTADVNKQSQFNSGLPKLSRSTGGSYPIRTATGGPKFKHYLCAKQGATCCRVNLARYSSGVVQACGFKPRMNTAPAPPTSAKSHFTARGNSPASTIAPSTSLPTTIPKWDHRSMQMVEGAVGQRGLREFQGKNALSCRTGSLRIR